MEDFVLNAYRDVERMIDEVRGARPAFDSDSYNDSSSETVARPEGEVDEAKTEVEASDAGEVVREVADVLYEFARIDGC